MSNRFRPLLACAPLIILTMLPSTGAAALPECTSAALRAAAPLGMTIGEIPNVGFPGRPQTTNGVAAAPANSPGDESPEYCFVTGTVVTNPATHKTANFAAALPGTSHWNGKFLFEGCGGNCGLAMLKPPLGAVRKGYAVFATDDGHVGPPSFVSLFDAHWAVSSPGRRDTDAVEDFFYRAVHAVVEAGKALTLRYYERPSLSRAYFDGCSDGGREGMVELARFPADFDGIIAGDPYFDIGGEIAGSLSAVQAQLRTPQAALTAAQLSEVDRIVKASCDAADGVVDGLIQNPAQCAFDPRKDLPKCGAGASAETCFSPDQIDSLSAILSAVTDPVGKVLYPGYPVSDLNDAGPTVDNLAFWVGFRSPPDTLEGPEPWSNPAVRPLAWSFANPTLRYLIYADEPAFNTLATPGIHFTGSVGGQIEGFHAVIPLATQERLVHESAAGNGNNPAAAGAYFKQGRKLILYHGLADGDITPYRTIQYYETLAKVQGGYGATQKNALLFLVPGMAHCGGGPGPNVFGQTGVVRATQGPDNDVLAALESWVEKGQTPQSLVATKYEQDDPKRPVLRTMPLCPFPAMARYAGTGDINTAENWSCPAADRRLLEVGRAGRQAGAAAALN